MVNFWDGKVLIKHIKFGCEDKPRIYLEFEYIQTIIYW